MNAAIDANGLIFHSLTVIASATPYISPSGKSVKMWLCQCVCGGRATVSIGHLRNGNTKSCGCIKKNNGRIGSPDKLLQGRRTKEYSTWVGMRQRCYSKSASGYSIYGGRGIKVCPRWSDFFLFLKDMGRCPSVGYSIDRIDTNGDYEPSNCRWATAKEQSNNTRKTRYFTIGQERKPLTEWLLSMSITRNAVNQRIMRGQTFEEIYEKFKIE